MPGEEPFGGYGHYGDRLDGTYGPILGTPWELSHDRKFQQIIEGEVTLPFVFPIAFPVMRAAGLPVTLIDQGRPSAAGVGQTLPADAMALWRAVAASGAQQRNAELGTTPAAWRLAAQPT